ncbi:hypothetical protein LINPERHAP1_LOCUS19297 [Linum perenne]
MGSDEDCELCVGAPEDVDHILRSCVFSKEVWGRIMGSTLSLNFFMESFDIGIVCWLLWKHRNEHLFEGKVVSPISVVEKSRYWMNLCQSSSIEAHR